VGGLAQSVKRLAIGWTVRGLNSGGGEIFRARPDMPWGPTSLLYNGYRFFPGRKEAGAWPWPPSPSSVEVKERVEAIPLLPLWAFVDCYGGEIYLYLFYNSNCLAYDWWTGNWTVFSPEYFDLPSVSTLPSLLYNHFTFVRHRFYTNTAVGSIVK
jgi:hypothetical protein